MGVRPEWDIGHCIGPRGEGCESDRVADSTPYWEESTQGWPDEITKCRGVQGAVGAYHVLPDRPLHRSVLPVASSATESCRHTLDLVMFPLVWPGTAVELLRH